MFVLVSSFSNRKILGLIFPTWERIENRQSEKRRSYIGDRRSGGEHRKSRKAMATYGNRKDARRKSIDDGIIGRSDLPQLPQELRSVNEMLEHLNASKTRRFLIFNRSNHIIVLVLSVSNRKIIGLILSNQKAYWSECLPTRRSSHLDMRAAETNQRRNA